MKKLLLCMLLVFIAVPAFAEDGFVSILTPVTVPSAESGASVINSILASVSMPYYEFMGDPDAAQMMSQLAKKEITQKLNAVTMTSYRHVGDMPLTRAVLGTVNFNLDFWPQVVQALQEKVQGATFIRAIHDANAVQRDVVPRARSVADHASKIIPNIVVPIAMMIMVLMFVIQIIATYLSPYATFSHFFVDIVKFMFFMILLMTYQTWIAIAIDIFNFASYLIAPWGGQVTMQKELAAAADAAGINLLDPIKLMTGIMHWLAYMSIRVLLIARDVMLAVALVIGPLCVAIGFATLYVQNDVLKAFLSGWMQTFFKLQFWGVFSAIALIGLSMVNVLSNFGALGLLEVAIMGIAFVHAAFNIPKLADNMSGVVVSSVLMATLAIGAQRAAGGGASAAGKGIGAGLKKLLGR